MLTGILFLEQRADSASMLQIIAFAIRVEALRKTVRGAALWVLRRSPGRNLKQSRWSAQTLLCRSVDLLSGICRVPPDHDERIFFQPSKTVGKDV